MLYEYKFNVVRKAIEKVKKQRGQKQLIAPDITFQSYNNNNSLTQSINKTECTDRAFTSVYL